MKRILAIAFLIVSSIILMFSTFSDSVKVPIDLKNMSIDELQFLADEINREIALRNTPVEESGKTEVEVHTFDNGYSISVTGVTVENGFCTIHYAFSHQNDSPTNFDIQDTVYQNGIELDSDYSSEDINSYMKKTLKNTTVEVTRTYKLVDNSTLTIYINPWFSNDKPYIVTIDLS